MLTLLIYLLFAFWFCIEITIIVTKKAAPAQDADNASLPTIWLAIIGALLLAYLVSLQTLGSLRAYMETVYIVSFCLLLLGLTIRLIAICTLKHYFTVNVAITDGHKIIQGGLYKYVRHPSYLGLLLAFAGLGLFLLNIISALILFGAAVLAFTMRIKVEEKVLIAHFGQAYKDYAKKTARLIPGVY